MEFKLSTITFILGLAIALPTYSIQLLKKAPSQEQIFLENLRKTVEQKKAETIQRLATSKNPKKQEKAKQLKEQRTHLDHIKIVTPEGTHYLQLEHSLGRMGIIGRSYPYNKEELNKKLHELCQKHGLGLRDIREVAIYVSTKKRRHPLLGILWLSDDLYSAAFYCGVNKKKGGNGSTPSERRRLHDHLAREYAERRQNS